ncbi:MAG: hypothetical protein ACLPXM_18815 [Terriglobales bacterium]
MKAKKKNPSPEHTGSTFDSFLMEEGIREEVEAVAAKRVLAWQLAQAHAEAAPGRKVKGHAFRRAVKGR